VFELVLLERVASQLGTRESRKVASSVLTTHIRRRSALHSPCFPGSLSLRVHRVMKLACSCLCRSVNTYGLGRHFVIAVIYYTVLSHAMCCWLLHVWRSDPTTVRLLAHPLASVKS
jgi:hypothetical protein